VNVSDIDTHRANKREAFDGMRAYHQSELSHKKDCIDILKAILTTMLVAFGGILAVVHSKQLDFDLARSASLLLLCFVALSVAGTVWATNTKISQDNARYRRYQSEYRLERLALKLEEDLWSEGFTSAWFEPLNSYKSGYHYTKIILRVFGLLIVSAAVLATLVVYGLTAGP
jgi:hypothetical protein